MVSSHTLVSDSCLHHARASVLRRPSEGKELPRFLRVAEESGQCEARAGCVEMEAQNPALGAGGSRLYHLHNSTHASPQPNPGAEAKWLKSERWAVRCTELRMGSMDLGSVPRSADYGTSGPPLYPPPPPSVYRRCTAAFSESTPSCLWTPILQAWGPLYGRCTYVYSEWPRVR